MLVASISVLVQRQAQVWTRFSATSLKRSLNIRSQSSHSSLWWRKIKESVSRWQASSQMTIMVPWIRVRAWVAQVAERVSAWRTSTMKTDNQIITLIISNRKRKTKRGAVETNKLPQSCLRQISDILTSLIRMYNLEVIEICVLRLYVCFSSWLLGLIFIIIFNIIYY